jgi:hypothetical protein
MVWGIQDEMRKNACVRVPENGYAVHTARGIKLDDLDFHSAGNQSAGGG